MSVVYTGQREAARRLGWFILFTIGVALIVTLYFVKTQAQTMRRDVHAIEASMAQERAAIKVLKAELAVLESPQRLSDLAGSHLGLEAVSPEQVRRMDEIKQAFSLRKDIDQAPSNKLTFTNHKAVP